MTLVAADEYPTQPIDQAGTLFTFGAGDFGVLGTGDEKDVLSPTPIRVGSNNDPVQSVAFGETHALCTTQHGQVFSWGFNGNGQLGHGDTQDRLSPKAIDALDTRKVTRIAAGSLHSLVIDQSGGALSFGANDFGQLGINQRKRSYAALPLGEQRWDLKDRKVPRVLKDFRDEKVVVVQIACGDKHSLMLTAAGEVYSAGDGSCGALGIKDKLDKTVSYPKKVIALELVPIQHVAAGNGISLAVSVTGALYTWGRGSRGALGHGTKENCATPKRVPRLPPVVYADMGSDFTAAIDHNFALWMFGHNSSGQLGNGTTEDFYAPKRVLFPCEPNPSAMALVPSTSSYDERDLDAATAGESDADANAELKSKCHVTDVACGLNHTIAVVNGNELYAFGNNTNGQLGLSDTESHTTPQRVNLCSLLKVDSATTTEGSLPVKSGASPNSDIDLDIELDVMEDDADDVTDTSASAAADGAGGSASLETSTPQGSSDATPVQMDFASDIPTIPMTTLKRERSHSFSIEQSSSTSTSALSALLTKSSISDADAPVGIPIPVHSSNKKPHLLSPEHPSAGGGLLSPGSILTDESVLASSAPEPDKQKGADFMLSSAALQSDSLARRQRGRRASKGGAVDDFRHRPVGEILSVACGTYTSAVVATTKDRPLRGLRDRNVAGLNNELFRKKVSAYKRALATGSDPRKPFLSLAVYIQHVFSSPTALNASFLPSEVSRNVRFRRVRHDKILQPQNLDYHMAQAMSFGDKRGPVGQAVFLPDYDAKNDSTERSETTVGVDVPSLEVFYATLLSLKNDKLFTMLRTATHACIKTLKAFLESYWKTRGESGPNFDSSAIRCLAIILHNPLLDPRDITMRETLVELCWLLAQVPPRLRQEYKTWWRHYDPELFLHRVVQPIVSLANHELERYDPRGANQQFDDRMRSVVHVLTRVNQVNYLPSPTAQSFASYTRDHDIHRILEDNPDAFLVPNEAFHLKDVEKHVNLAKDFIEWEYYMKNPHVVMQKPLFTFCQHSFLLSNKVKARIMQIETMKEEHNAVRATRVQMFGQQLEIIQGLIQLSVRRDHILEDAKAQLQAKTAEELKAPLRIKFVGEDGVDYGGVTKEFFELIVGELMKPEAGLFAYNAEMRTMWYNPNATKQSDLEMFFLCGEILGLALRNSASVGMNFPKVFFRQLLKMEPTLLDLREADPPMYNSLEQVLRYEGDDVEDVFGLSFEVSAVQVQPTEHKDDGEAGSPVARATTVELVPGGANIPVNNHNRVDFVEKYMRYILHGSVEKQANAIVEGFRLVCAGYALTMFAAEDLEALICGSRQLDFKALEKSTLYHSGYHKDHRLIRWFWDIVQNEFTPQQQRELLLFCTGSARAPMGGLGDLKIIIQKAGADSELIPYSSTCFNTLVIPDYPTKEKLRRKLLISLRHGQGGFGMQ